MSSKINMRSPMIRIALIPIIGLSVLLILLLSAENKDSLKPNLVESGESEHNKIVTPNSWNKDPERINSEDTFKEDQSQDSDKDQNGNMVSEIEANDPVFDQLKLLLSSDEWQSVESLLISYDSNDFRKADLIIELSDLYQNRYRDPETALAILEQYVPIDPIHPILLQQLIRVYQEQGLLGQKLGFLEELMSHNSIPHESALIISRVLKQNGNPQAAIELLESNSSIRQGEEDWQQFEQLGDAYFAELELELAIKNYSKSMVMVKDPDRRRHLCAKLSKSQLLMGDQELAMQTLLKYFDEAQAKHLLDSFKI